MSLVDEIKQEDKQSSSAHKIKGHGKRLFIAHKEGIKAALDEGYSIKRI